MKNTRLFSGLLALVLLLSFFPVVSGAEGAVSAGDSFTYTKAEHWGKESDIWSWQWAPADSEAFSDMTFTTVEGQGECYVADWEKYPYCAARSGGSNVHPNAAADSARVFTAPASGWVTVTATVKRVNDYTVPSYKSPTSFRILLEETTVYPTTGDYLVLTSTTAETVTVQVFVKKGERLRFVVGAMDNQQSDGVTMETTARYDTVETVSGEVFRAGETFTHSKTSATWGTDDPHWSWEWTPAGKSSFSPMTYQYVEKYGRYMYASDWETNPYNYVDSLGVKLHPAATADTVKTFTVPYTGTVDLETEVSRYVNLSEVTTSGANGSSLRILVNHTQVYPLYSGVLELETTTPKTFHLSLPVTAGDKIRIIIGGMGQVTSDAVKMYNTVTYTSTEKPAICVDDADKFSVTEAQWANNDMGNWSFEYRDEDDSFGNMTYQYVEYYGRYMYASDWTNHAFNCADLLGVKLHPAKTRDAVKTYTAPYSGRIRMNIQVQRYSEYVEEGNKTPTSLRVYKNEEQIWPTNGSQKELTSTETFNLNVYADVRAGDKIRCVVGSMGNTTADGIKMYNTVTYRAVGTRELMALADQYNQRIDVIDVQGDNLNSAETAWSWKPTEALGFSSLSSFNSPTDAKLRYSKNLKKYVVAVCSSRGFMGVADFATGKCLWQVSLTDEANPHAIEYLPNGNVAVAGSHGDWIRVYAASQGKTTSTYAQATLEGAHGVLWDEQRKLLWALGTEEITAYKIGGTAAKPTLTEQTAYHVAFTDEIRSGHDLVFVSGNSDRLWITSKTVMQYDIPSKSIVRDYDQREVLDHNAVKGIANFPDSTTVAYVYPNKTYLDHDSDRIFVNIHQDGRNFGITHTHSSGAYYKVRSWVASYNPEPHRSHVEETIPGKAAGCTSTGLTEGKICAICDKVLVAQQEIPATGHVNTSTNVTDATCTEDGSVVVTCACGEIVSTEIVAALGHSYGYENNGENHAVTCANCDYTATEDHNYVDGRCICGAVESTEPALDSTLSFGAQLYLENDLTMAFRVKGSKLANYDVSTAYLVVEREVYESGATEAIVVSTTISEYTVSADGRYVFSYPGIAAAQMNDAIRATLYIKDANGKEYVSPVLHTSVAAYLDGLLSNSTSDTKLVTLIMDMVNYGAAAQVYFDRHADAPVNEAFQSFKTYASYASADFTTVLEDLSGTTANEGATGKLNQGLDLGTRIGIQYKVTLPNGINAEDAQLVITDAKGNELETIEVSTGTVDSKGRYIVNFYGSTSKDMRRVVYATAYANGAAITGTYAYSISTYAWGIQENASAMDANLVNVTRAMMLYGDSASAYFG